MWGESLKGSHGAEQLSPQHREGDGMRAEIEEKTR